MRIYIIVIYIFIFCQQTTVQAQMLTVYTPSLTSTASKPSYISMIRSLFGPGIKVLDIRVPKGDTLGTVPDSVQMGWFNATGTGLSLAKGFLMTTGFLKNAIGPNDFETTSGSYYNPPIINGDVEIRNRFWVDPFSPTTTAPTNYPHNACVDAASIEVDFTPYWDSLTIKYVFASEEYHATPPILPFPASIFPTNDGFALLLKEMGQNAIWKNIALLPNGDSVCVRTVNNVTNSLSYIPNPISNNSKVEYDGYTRVLRAKAALDPCKSYTLKFVIADINDSGRDSGVFIEEGGIGTNKSFRTHPAYTAHLIDKVINISGARFSAINSPNLRVAHNALDINDTVKWYKNPYLTGEKGIWRVRENFSYLANRNQFLASVGITPNTKASGMMDSVALWDATRLRMPMSFPKWKKTQTITNYDVFGQEVENRDILDIYSAALYDKGSRAIAVANNARNAEIGVDGFEDYKNGQMLSQLENTAGNIDLVPKVEPDPYRNYVPYEIVNAEGNIIEVKATFASALPLTNRRVKVIAFAEAEGNYPAEEVTGEFTIECVYNHTATTSKWVLTPIAPGFVNNNSGRIWTGTLYLISKPLANANAIYSYISYDSTKAHTGRMSLKVAKNTTSASFKQHELKLAASPKKYYCSFWVNYNTSNLSPDNSHVPISLFRKPAVTSTTPSPSLVALTISTNRTDIIEGWQQVQISFSIPSEKDTFYVRLNSLSFDYNLDDIRIQPEDSELKTYVYNPLNERLEAILDENNFATFYNYDDQGNLYSVRKETEEGIKTIQTIQTHLQE